MKELGKQIEVHWLEAGHGSYVVDQTIAHQELLLEFAYRVLSRQRWRLGKGCLSALSLQAAVRHGVVGCLALTCATMYL